jgi:Holliday junction resolvase
MASHYQYGRRKELKVAEHLERRRFQRAHSRGSRGAVDLFAKGKSRRAPLLAIQVKSTRSLSISGKRLSETELTKLVSTAKAHQAIPILALVSRNYVWFSGYQMERFSLRVR